MVTSELLIGDAAPELRILTYLRGEPLRDFAQGTVHVVEFWATWCGPCLAAMPHLNALQDRYPAVPFLAVAVRWDDLGEVRAFVEAPDSPISTRVAVDVVPEKGQSRGWMMRHWVEAAYRSGIPSAFIIDREGRVAWIGHPDELDEPLAAIVGETWDLPTRAQEHLGRLAVTLAREHRALRAALGELDEGDISGRQRALEDAFAGCPDLEGTAWAKAKFDLLSGHDDAAAIAYARHLAATRAADAGDQLFRLGTSAAKACMLPKGATDVGLLPAMAQLAVDLLTQAEPVMMRQPIAFELATLSRLIAEAQLVLGRVDDALARARIAHGWAREANAHASVLAEIDSVVARASHCDSGFAKPPEAEGLDTGSLADRNGSRRPDSEAWGRA